MRIKDYLGIIDTGKGKDKLYDCPVVVAKVTGDVYAAIDTETGKVRYYPFWTPMTKFNVGGFFVVTLGEQISDKVKELAKKFIAKANENDESYTRAVEQAEADRERPNGQTKIDEMYLEKVQEKYDEYKDKGYMDDGLYVNLF